jgi:hypothetical protein
MSFTSLSKFCKHVRPKFGSWAAQNSWQQFEVVLSLVTALDIRRVYDTLNCTEVFLSFFCIILILVCLIPEVARSME